MVGNSSIHNNEGDRDRWVAGSFTPVDDARTVGSRTTRDTMHTTSEDRIVESIYNHVMQSICRDVAANMHEMIKTGSEDVIPSSWKLFTATKTPTRRELYPELYNGSDGNSDSDNETSNNDNTTETTGEGGHRTSKSTRRKRMTDEEIESILDKYAVDLPISSSSASPTRTTNGKRRPPRDMAKEEEERRLLTKIKKEKESKYKHDSEEDGDDITNNDDDEDDDDDEDFKMEDADGEDDDDDDENLGGTRRKKRALSSLSTAPSVGSAAEPRSLSTAPAGVTDPTMTTMTTTAATATNSGNHSGVGHPKVDIWGKTPAKEPKNRLCRCQLCGRLISTSRFASHLDKCMGLSTSRGGPLSLSGSLGSTKGMLLSSASSMSGLGLKKTKRGSTILK